jgi:hypothetical protein
MAVEIHAEAGPFSGVPRQLFSMADALPGGTQYATSGDGQRFLVRQRREALPDVPITVVLNWWVDLAKRAQ